MAFRVLLIAPEAPLPDNTALTVEHGTGTEVFLIAQPFPSSDVVFCCLSTREGECVEPPDASAYDGGSDAPPVEGLFCELWTDGPADVTVEARGYPELKRNLEARSNDGCLQTVDVTLELERPDAAP